jgi:hypothetical protein
MFKEPAFSAAEIGGIVEATGEVEVRPGGKPGEALFAALRLLRTRYRGEAGWW